MYSKFVKKITIVNVVLALILIVMGFVPTVNWKADATYIICGVAQLLATVLIPLRTKNVDPKENEMTYAELFVQENWVILALGLAGACTYLAPFVDPGNPAMAYVAFADGLITLLVGIFGMYKSVKMTGVDLMV